MAASSHTTIKRAATGPAKVPRRIRTLNLVFCDGRVVSPPVSWRMRDTGKVTVGREGDLVVPDPEASRRHIEIARAPGYEVLRVKDADSANGLFLGGRRVESGYLHAGAVLRLGGALLAYAEVPEHPALRDLKPMPGVSLARALAEAVADAVAPTRIPVLVSGPTGAGKELVARRLHDGSGRSGPLVPVNCAAIPRELVGSELFGHVKGAFSGAQGAREGLFVSANGGTLFLDEVAELPPEQQSALLRVLQEGRVRPVGSDSEVTVDARVVATHQDLEALAETGAFRSDLYARLAGMVVELPGLAERREEVLTLLCHFLGDREVPLTLEAAEALLLYEWPRNVRELQMAARALEVFIDSVDSVDLSLLPPAVQRAAPGPEEAADDRPGPEALAELLGRHGGNVAQVARELGQHRQQVYRWLRTYGIDAAQFRDS